MLTVLSLTAGFFLDLLFGDPRWLPHPVVLIGKAISFLERALRAVFPKTPRGELIAGGLLTGIMISGTYLAVFGLLRLAARVHPDLAFGLECFLCYQALAAKCLRDAVTEVYAPLSRGDLPAARLALGRIVGRDTASLDAAAVIRGAVETAAENASDGVAAPMLYFILGGAPLAWAYKAVNTMDSMVGYKNERYMYFGRAAAQTDDAANLLPARLTACLIIAASALLRLDWRGAYRIWRRDRRCHTSPNSAHPEAAAAGALGIRLGGPSVYYGVLSDKPWIGDSVREAAPEDIPRMGRLLYGAAFLGFAVCCAARLLAGNLLNGTEPWN